MVVKQCPACIHLCAWKLDLTPFCKGKTVQICFIHAEEETEKKKQLANKTAQQITTQTTKTTSETTQTK